MPHYRVEVETYLTHTLEMDVLNEEHIEAEAERILDQNNIDYDEFDIIDIEEVD